MFEHLDRDNHEDGSEERYQARLKKHQDSYSDRQRHLFWWLVHNCLAHPMIGVMPVGFAFRFHDWTSRRINKVEE